VPGADKDVKALKVWSVHCRWKDKNRYSVYSKMFKLAVVLLFHCYC